MLDHIMVKQKVKNMTNMQTHLNICNLTAEWHFLSHGKCPYDGIDGMIKWLLDRAIKLGYI